MDSTLGGSVSYLWSKYKDMVNTRLTVSSPLEMSLWVEYPTINDTTGTAHLQIVAVDSIINSTPRLHLTVVEDSCVSGTKVYNQMLRDYLGGYMGYVITMAEGDTILWDEDFVLKHAWAEDKCRIVAFVQDKKGATIPRQILQVVQAPVLTPTPAEVTDLTVTLVNDDLLLEWPAVTITADGDPIEVDYYNVYRDTVAFFGPGSDPFDGVISLSFMDTTGAVGDTTRHYYYAVTAVAAAKESGHSLPAGEFDRSLINSESPPK